VTSSSLCSQYSIAEGFAGILSQQSSKVIAYHCKLFGLSLSTIGRSALNIYSFAIYWRINGGLLEPADSLRYFCISLLRLYIIIAMPQNPTWKVTASQLQKWFTGWHWTYYTVHCGHKTASTAYLHSHKSTAHTFTVAN